MFKIIFHLSHVFYHYALGSLSLLLYTDLFVSSYPLPPFLHPPPHTGAHTLMEDLQLVRPTVLVAVPQLFIRVYDGIHTQVFLLFLFSNIGWGGRR